VLPGPPRARSADLAQLVEHPPCKREVIRSIRIVGTSNFKVYVKGGRIALRGVASNSMLFRMPLASPLLRGLRQIQPGRKMPSGLDRFALAEGRGGEHERTRSELVAASTSIETATTESGPEGQQAQFEFEEAGKCSRAWT
jgi:hypothetical protein